MVSTMKLRPYQSAAVDAVLREWETSRSTLVVAATGTGKTVLFSHIASRRPKRVMVVAHRGELIHQAAGKLEAITGEKVGVEMADSYSDMSLLSNPRIVVASIQTLTAQKDKRLKRYIAAEFSTLIIDEAHHAPAPTYRRVIEHFAGSKVVGVTATPDRADEAAMGAVFDAVAYEYDLSSAITDGWLVPVRCRTVAVEGLDYSQCGTVAGDLNQSDVAKAQSSERVLQQLVRPAVELSRGRRTIIFVAPGYMGAASGDQYHIAERFTEILQRYPGMAAARRVGQDTHPDERSETLRRFRDGEVPAVVNVGVLTEGFDDPQVDCVVLARPTKSRSLYAQMVGRGTRPLPGVVDSIDGPVLRRRAIADSSKPRLEVIDLVGNAGRHTLVHATDILSGKDPDEVMAAARAKADNGADILDALEEARAEYEDERRRKAAIAAAAAEKRRSIMANVTFNAVEFDPFAVFDIVAPQCRGWDIGRKITPGQASMLSLHGVPHTEDMPLSHAKILVGEVFERQRRKLVPFRVAAQRKAAGLDPDVTMGQHLEDVRKAKVAL